MEMDEQALIAHLLEVEEQASELVNQAQLENDRIIAQTRATADSEYDEKLKQMISSFEDDYNKKIETYKAEHQASIDKYKNEILKTEKNIDSFDKLLQSIL